MPPMDRGLRSIPRSKRLSDEQPTSRSVFMAEKHGKKQSPSQRMIASCSRFGSCGKHGSPGLRIGPFALRTCVARGVVLLAAGEHAVVVGADRRVFAGLEGK